MKINVDSGNKQDEIIELLEANEQPIFKYLGHPNNFRGTIQFEVENFNDGDDVVKIAKDLIKNTKFGKLIAFRVVEDGKFM